MRNLKRALSLALASVMLIGMMVTGANALSFEDADEISNVTAATVLEQLGIMVGDGTNFHPEQTVTRAEMAVIVCTILYGERLNVDQFVDGSKFTDVPANHWANGYVNLANSLNIIVGYGDGTFGPNDPVTTAQATLMLTKALGWFQAGELVDNWSTDSMTIVTKGTQLGLFGNLRLANNEGLTRDNVAVLTFNAITKTVPVMYNSTWNVYYTDSQSIMSGTKFNYTNTLGYENFDLVYTTHNQTDDFGRPSKAWGVGRSSGGVDDKGDLIQGGAVTLLDIDAAVVEPEEADIVYTKGVTSKDLTNAVGKTVADSSGDYTWNVYSNGAELSGYPTGCYPTTGLYPVATGADHDGDDYGLTGRGVQTEIFVDGANAEVTVVYVNYYLAKVARVGTDSDGRYVTLALENSVTVKERNFHTSDFESGDYLMVTVAENKDGDSYIASAQAAETVEGEVTAYSETSGGRYITLDGKKYDISKNNAADIDKSGSVEFTDYRLYLDPFGYVSGYEQTGNAVSNYLYIVNGSVTSDVDNWRARAVFPDGTAEVISIQKKNAASGSFNSSGAGKVYHYELQSNGEYVLYNNDSTPGATYKIEDTLTGNIVNGSSRVDTSDGRRTVDLNTRFIHVNEDTRTYNSYTGYNEVPDIDNVGHNVPIRAVDHNRDGIVDVIYLIGGTATNSDSMIFYVAKVGANDWGSIKKGDTTYYKFDAAYVDGEQQEIVVNEDVRATISKQGAGAYKVLATNSDGYITDLDDVNTGVFQGSGYFTKGQMNDVATGLGNNAFVLRRGGSYTYNSSTIFVYVDGDKVSLGSAGSIITNEKNATDATGVFVAKTEKTDNDLATLVFVVAMKNSVVPGASDSTISTELTNAEPGSTVTVTDPDLSGALTVPANKNLVIQGEVKGTITSSGNTTLKDATITNNLSATKSDDGTVKVTGNTTVAASKTLTVSDVTLGGTLNLKAGSTLSISGTVTTESGATIVAEENAQITVGGGASAGALITMGLKFYSSEGAPYNTAEELKNKTFTYKPNGILVGRAAEGTQPGWYEDGEGGGSSEGVKAVYESDTVTIATLTGASNKITVNNEDVTVTSVEDVAGLVTELKKISSLSTSWTIEADGENSDAVKFTAKTPGADATLSGLGNAVTPGANAIAAVYSFTGTKEGAFKADDTLTLNKKQTTVVADGTEITEGEAKITVSDANKLTVAELLAGQTVTTIEGYTGEVSGDKYVFTANTAGAVGNESGQSGPDAAVTDANKPDDVTINDNVKITFSGEVTNDTVGTEAVAAVYKLTDVAQKLADAKAQSGTLTVGGHTATVTADTLDGQLDQFVADYNKNATDKAIWLASKGAEGKTIVFTAKTAGAVGGQGPAADKVPNGATEKTPGVDATVDPGDQT